MDQVGQGLLDAAGIDKDLQILPKFVGRAGGGVALAIAGPAVIGAVGNTAVGVGITGFVAAHVPAAAITYTGWGLAIAGASASVYSGYQHARAGEYDLIANDLTGLLGSGIVRNQSQRYAKTVAAKQATGLVQNQMFKHALQPYRGGFTNAGRALTKHPNIVGATSAQELTQRFGNNTGISKAAAEALKNIMRNGQQTAKTTKAYGDVIDFKLPSGLGARFNATTNQFIGFLGR